MYKKLIMTSVSILVFVQNLISRIISVITTAARERYAS